MRAALLRHQEKRDRALALKCPLIAAKHQREIDKILKENEKGIENNNRG